MTSLYAFTGRVVYWLIWPGSWLYLRGSHRTRLLVMCGDQVLVVKNWLSNGEWKLPGGGLKPVENPADGAARELSEETGIWLDAGTFRILAVEAFHLHGFHYTGHFYAVTLDKKTPLKVNPYEIVGISWLSRTEVSAETCGPDVLRALELAQPLDTL